MLEVPHSHHCLKYLHYYWLKNQLYQLLGECLGNVLPEILQNLKAFVTCVHNIEISIHFETTFPASSVMYAFII